jgi:hypothetical protein
VTLHHTQCNLVRIVKLGESPTWKEAQGIANEIFGFQQHPTSLS